ncbi:putative DnaJ domain, Chaperone J-domain superfamily [Helianthus debilis subsp. tardiflorus]
MVATFEIFAAAWKKVNCEIDLYSVSELTPSADRSVLKKQYKNMAVLLHPDKNKTFGADEAFKRVSEAWSVLSDSSKRNCYDVRINSQFVATVSQFVNLDTFWTVCTSCRV